jgi:hypothetical protein
MFHGIFSGIPPGHPMLGESSYTAAIMERLAAERMSAERLSAERLQAERLAMHDPMIRLQMSGISGASAAAAAAAAAAQHAHTHTHAHSHTHLHLHQPDGLNPPGPPGIPTSSPLHHPLLQPHLLHPLHPGKTIYNHNLVIASRVQCHVFTLQICYSLNK